ncbi:MAG: hypothetical protein IJ774_07605 [Selenomonadaceae bacterium]|nr:hypothetical protein [Selenomonadaceae bacterium]MBR1806234.1 hypothetical protein [Selenomonadaceae bacterium]
MIHLNEFRIFDGQPLIGDKLDDDRFSPNWKPINLLVGNAAAIKTGLRDKNKIDICEGDILKASFEFKTNHVGRFVVRYMPMDARFVIRFEWGKNFRNPSPDNSMRVCDLNMWLASNSVVISNVILMEMRRDLRSQKKLFGIKFSSTGFKLNSVDAGQLLDFIHEKVPLNWDEHITEIKAKLQGEGHVKLKFRVNDGQFQSLEYEPSLTMLLKPDENLILPENES